MILLSIQRLFSVLFFIALVVSVGHAFELAPLSDEQLGDISGQEGVLLSQEYYYNSNPATGGRDDAYCNASVLNCRFTWQIAGREEGVAHSGMTNPKGEWLVYKDGYLSLSVRRLGLDAAFLGEATSSGSSYNSFYNPERFKDSFGNCLLEGVTDCDANATARSQIRLMPSMKASYPETIGSYNSATKQSTGYNDVRFALSFTGLAIEYDQLGSPGYLNNDQGSYMGVSIADNNGPMAGIAFGGDFYLYGF